MRPLKLELEGFSVYRKRQSIDFSKLSFFVIQGKTGAGKTSIVDAITFALYGRVPRYGTQKAHRMVLSRGSDRMKVSLDFSVGGRRYRIERFYRAKPEDYSVRVYEGEKRLDLGKAQVDRWIEKVTGLDYRTFTRVILLPQGEFDRFLKPSSPRERREILINLLDLEIFETARKIASERYKHLTGKKEILEQEMKSLEEVDPQAVEKLEREGREIEARRNKIEREIERLEGDLKKAEEKAKLEEDLRETTRRLRILEEKEKEIEELSEKLRKAEKTAPFMPYLDQLDKIRSSLRDARLKKEKLTKAQIKIRSELRDLTEKLKKIEKEAERLPELRNELEETLLTLEKVKGALEDLAQSAEKKKKAEEIKKTLKSKEKDLEELRQRVEKGERLTQEVKENLEKLDFDEEKYLLMIKLSKDLERAKKRKEDLESLKTRLEKVRNRLKETSEGLEKLKKDLDQKEEDLSKAGISFHAHSIRSLIKKGDRCPVCGNTYHDPPPLEESENYEELKREVEQLKGKVLELEREKAGLEKEEKMILEDIKDSERDLKDLREVFEDNFEEKLKDLEEKRRRKKTLEEKLKKYLEALSQRKEEFSSLSLEIEKLRAEARSLERESRELAQKVEAVKGILLPGESLKKAEDRLRQKKEDLKTKIEEIEISLNRVRKLEEEKRQDLVRVNTSLEDLEQAIEDLEKNEKETLKKLTPLFDEFRDLEEVRRTALGSQQIEEIRKRIENHRIEKENLILKAKEIKKALEEIGKVPDAGDLREKLRIERDQLKSLLKRSGEINQEIQQIRSALERKEEIKKQLKEIEKDIRIYEILREDLKSDRLQDFASSLMLSRIVERAGEYLLSFTGNYEFHLDERGEMVVIDRAQGVERSVSSLSGGETFLASLSLALGVSDILSANAHLESLFIDEGFGSLDEETRERVSDMLELIKQKIRRMVGIISHIPDLAERFHQRIQVVREESGSTIKVVY